MKGSAALSTATASPHRSPGSFAASRPERIGLTGPSPVLDPRVDAYRRDIADIALAGRVFAPHYAAPTRCRLTVPDSPLHAAPSASAPAVSQLVAGEEFLVLDMVAGWAWGRCAHDSYVGYLPADRLGHAPAPTHRVVAPLALLFADPDVKSPVTARWPIGARFAGRADGAFLATQHGYVHARHAAPLGRALDAVGVAESLLGQPYLWGGRGGGGIDCSGLVQVAMAMAGRECPRDSDMQRDTLGDRLADGAALARGDVVFFPGHVGLMVDAARLIHANAFAMAVTIEPLADVVARLSADHARPLLCARRLP